MRADGVFLITSQLIDYLLQLLAPFEIDAFPQGLFIGGRTCIELLAERLSLFTAAMEPDATRKLT